MKTLGALLILGASHVSASDIDYNNLRPGGYINYGGSKEVVMKIENDIRVLKTEGFEAGADLKIFCQKAKGLTSWSVGDDKAAYGDKIEPFESATPASVGATADTSAHSEDATLVYACQLQKKNGNDYEAQDITGGAKNSDLGYLSNVATEQSWFRVHYEGTCDTSLSATEFTSSVGAQGYNKGKTLTAPMTVTAKFPCIPTIGFTQDLTFDLHFEGTSTAKSQGIVSGQQLQRTAKITNSDRTTDGKTYVYSGVHTFDLGADLPHPDYYKSGVASCSDSNTDEDLCKGGLKSTLSLKDKNAAPVATLYHSDSTELVGFDSAAVGKRFKACTHNSTNPLADAARFEFVEACYGTGIRDRIKSWTSGGNGAVKLADDVLEDVDNGSLLDPMVCPFQCPSGSSNCPLSSANTVSSTVASAMACLNNGVKANGYTPHYWDNRCAERTKDKDENTTPTRAEILGGKEVINQQYMGTGFSFTSQFTRGSQAFQQYTTVAAAGETNLGGIVKLVFNKYEAGAHHSDVNHHDVIMELTSGSFEDSIKTYADFYTVESKDHNFVYEISKTDLNTDKITVPHVPTYVKSLTLYGQVFTTCDRKQEALSDPMDIKVDQKLKASGKFRPVNWGVTSGPNKFDPCNPLFEYVRDDDDQGDAYTISGVMEGSQFVADPSKVKVCNEAKGTATGTSCARTTSHTHEISAGTDTPVALLEGLCDVGGIPRNKGVIGALVAFDGNRAYAPVICPGTCRRATIHDVDLDWKVELAVSASNNVRTDSSDVVTRDGDDNKLIVRQSASAWGDDEKTTEENEAERSYYYSLERVAYLTPVSRDDCQADGTLKIDDDSIPSDNNVATGCLVNLQTKAKLASASWQTPKEYEGIEKAQDVVDWFKRCGSQTALGAEVHLVQRFKVDYGDDRDISFCQTKKLSVSVQSVMIGESTQTLTTVQQADAEDDASIEAILDKVRFTDDGCAAGSGEFRLEAVTKIDSAVQLEASGATKGIFDSDGTKYENNAFTWSTVCADVCGIQAGTLPRWQEEHELAVKLSDKNDQNGAAVDIGFTIHMNEGSPCSQKDSVDRAQVTLQLYNAGPVADDDVASTCTDDKYKASKDDDNFLSPQASTEKVCGRLIVTGLGDSKLYVTRTKLTRHLPGQSGAELLCEAAADEQDPANDEYCESTKAQEDRTLRNKLFANTKENEGLVFPDSFPKYSDSAIKLVPEDAFANITYTVFWEQRLGSRRRLLRSDLVLGAGESEAKGSITVLPVSDQIEDAVESLDAHQTQTDAPADNAEEEKSSGWSTGAIVGVSVGGVALLAGVAYAGMQVSGSGFSLGAGLNRPKRREYTQVRRSERFSTMKF